MVRLGTVGLHLILELHILHVSSSLKLRAAAEPRSHRQHGQLASGLDLDPQNHLPANHAPIQLFTVHKVAQILGTEK